MYSKNPKIGLISTIIMVILLAVFASLKTFQEPASWRIPVLVVAFSYLIIVAVMQARRLYRQNSKTEDSQ
ncbi:hypothetical protein LF817_19085 [Halobacillus sp. A1]|uniref:hypothetical protein n=1 Tax=Halobacillus sp. A1 TaxID=2880262 RepID=UPI0020A628AB|nr:hypothetical protein [Halobacillus sp. A1]MCP3033433.1 hypothetical protein [Halobacillus sp. A1]